jgi:hypothetical protein
LLFLTSVVSDDDALLVDGENSHVTFGGRELQIHLRGLQLARARLHAPLRIVIAEESAGEFEGPVESLCRTPAGVCAIIAINGYVQTLETDLSIERAAALGSHVPILCRKSDLSPDEQRTKPASGS